MIARASVAQVTRFGIVGGVATAVHSGVYLAVIELFTMPALLGNLLGFGLAVCVSFLGHRHWTFRQGGAFAFPRFALTALLGLGLNSFFTYAVVDLAKWPPWAAIPFFAVVTPTIVYMLLRFWVFTD